MSLSDIWQGSAGQRRQEPQDQAGDGGVMESRPRTRLAALAPGARRAAAAAPLISSSTISPIFSQKIREYKNVSTSAANSSRPLIVERHQPHDDDAMRLLQQMQLCRPRRQNRRAPP